MKRIFFSLVFALFVLVAAMPAQAADKRTWQDESIYFIMVDRFNNGNPQNDIDVDTNDPKAYHGGDLQGVIDKLDYIKAMGFTAIWLTPIFQNEPGGYHGYWISDFYKVDPHFGTIQDVKRLVKEAHKRDMKVILDFVVNHTGPHHPWLNDPMKKEWFHEKKDIFNWTNQTEVENGWLFGLPDLAQENPEVKRYLLEAAKWWIQQTDIDGYRLDTVKHVPKSFWQEFSKAVKSVKKDFFLLGEVWHDDPRYIADYRKYGIDGFLDFPFYQEASKIFSKSDQSLEPLYNVWRRNETFYERPYLLGTFLDNHDTVRFTRLALENRQNPIKRIKLGLTYLFSAPGIPIMYYGTEIGMDGGKDPDNRRLMNFRTDQEIIDYIKKIGALRNDVPALRRGDFTLLYEKNGMAVFKRTYHDQTAVIAINNTSKTAKAHISNEQLEPGKELHGLLVDDLVRSDKNGYDIILNRETAEIYVLGKKTGLNVPFISAIIAVYVLFGLFLYYVKKRSKARG